MQIKKWHPGKLVILWLWSGGIAVWLMSLSQTVDIKSAQYMYLASLMAAIAFLVLPTVITWVWLGSKE
jgi:hypothetical protein